MVAPFFDSRCTFQIVSAYHCWRLTNTVLFLSKFNTRYTLALPSTRSSLKLTNRCFRYVSPYTWNELRDELCQPHEIQLPSLLPLITHGSSSSSLPPLSSSLTPSLLHSWFFLPRCIVRASVVFVIVMPSVRPSVRLSVYPSHSSIVTKRMKIPPIFLYHVQGKFIYFFGHKEWLVGMPLLPGILGQTDPPSFKNGDFHSIFARSGLTVGPSEKMFNYDK